MLHEETAARAVSIEELARDPRLGVPQIQVLNAETGEVLFDRDGNTPTRTASVLKVLTSAAALSVLGPDYRVPTTVVAGSAPGEIVLVGGGDVTLSRLPTGSPSFYAEAPHLDALAGQVKTAWAADRANTGVPITRLVLDASLFGGPGWQPSWDPEDRTEDGCMSYITALQADADRDDPTEGYSPRGSDPIGRVGEAFAALLGPDIEVARGRSVGDAASHGTASAARSHGNSGTGPVSGPNSPVSDATRQAVPEFPEYPGARVLGRVYSQPVSVLIGQGLRTSDNVTMEMLARLLAITLGTGNTFDALQAGVLQALQVYGVPTTGIRVADGSGLSVDNAVPPSYLTRLFVKVANRENGLGVLYDSLPVSGKNGTGTLSEDRFTGPAAIVEDNVHAKTGWINTVYSLAGIVHARDGATVTFAVYALGDVESDAKQAIDALVAGIFIRGGRAANYRS